VTRVPGHAGRLRPWERFVFALVFALMAGFVVAITVSAARPRQNPPLAGPAAAARVPASAATPPGLRTGGSSAVQNADQSASDGAAGVRPPTAKLNAQLAAALREVLRGHRGQLAVGVIDTTTSRQALYRAGLQCSAGSIMTPDILTALLVRRQQAHTPVTGQQAYLATAMMDSGSDVAATALWRTVGGANGIASANRRLMLRHTVAHPGGAWSQTTTTAADQLQLLMDLTSARSPLSATARDYVLGLMAGDATGQRSGVAAAATPGTGYAAGSGWLPDGDLWAVNSIGVVRHGGQVLLIVVLASNTRTEAAGLSLASAAAIAAADVITQP
jgi:hypothetical protein